MVRAPLAGPRHVTAELIILSYNGRELLEVVLPSAVNQRFAGFSVTVVDDASSDDTIAYLAREWPEVRVLRTPRNLGVTAALNWGWRHSTAEYVALLNNDVELDPDWLGALVESLQRHGEAASATGKMLNFWRRDVLDGAGDLMTRSGACTRRGHGQIDRGQYDSAEAVLSACGGAALYRRRAFEIVGPFDEDFYAYLEDVDWGLRAQLAGFTCRYEPAGRIYHMGSATTDRDDRRHASFYLYLLRRNQVSMVLKDFPLALLCRHARPLVTQQIVLALGGVRDGSWRVVARAWGGVLRQAPATLRKRRAIQGSRRVGADHVDGLLAPQ